MNAELGVLATLVDNQNHDEKESAGEHSEAHSHRHLFKQRHSRLTHSYAHSHQRSVHFASGAMTYHKHSTLWVLCDVHVRIVRRS